jgi:hypothetical protein
MMRYRLLAPFFAYSLLGFAQVSLCIPPWEIRHFPNYIGCLTMKSIATPQPIPSHTIDGYMYILEDHTNFWVLQQQITRYLLSWGQNFIWEHDKAVIKLLYQVGMTLLNEKLANAYSEQNFSPACLEDWQEIVTLLNAKHFVLMGHLKTTMPTECHYSDYLDEIFNYQSKNLSALADQIGCVPLNFEIDRKFLVHYALTIKTQDQKARDFLLRQYPNFVNLNRGKQNLMVYVRVSTLHILQEIFRSTKTPKHFGGDKARFDVRSPSPLLGNSPIMQSHYAMIFSPLIKHFSNKKPSTTTAEVDVRALWH